MKTTTQLKLKRIRKHISALVDEVITQFDNGYAVDVERDYEKLMDEITSLVKRPGLASRVRGEGNYNARLTERQVKIIKALLRAGNTKAILAKQFGVSYSTISKIAFNRTWTSVKETT